MRSPRHIHNTAARLLAVQLAAALAGACLGVQTGDLALDDAHETATGGSGAPSTPSTQAAAGGAAANPNADTQDKPGDGGTTAPAVFNCDEATYPVCDGFETAEVGAPPNPQRWDSEVALPPPDDGAVHSDHPELNRIEVSDKFAHTGKHSLHFHSSPGWAHLPIMAITSAAYPKAFLPAPNGSFYVRLWLYNDGHGGDHGVSPDSGHWYLVNASGPLNGRQQYQKFGGGGGTLGWNYYGNDDNLGSNVALPTGQWTCLETHFKGDSHEIFVWHDGQAVDSLHTTNWAAPNYNRLTIGWEMDHPAGDYPGLDVYIDDVAFGYSRIGCAVTPP